MKPLALPILALSFAACSPIQKEMHDSETRIEEEHLLDAGFKIMIADTKERQDMFSTLPSEHLSRLQRPEGVFYIYADPDTCGCFYVGRDIEFQKLQQLAVDSRVSSQALMTHEIQQEYQSGWGAATPWGFWTPGGIGANPMGTPAWDPH
jgi:hypothetical protein